MLYKPLRSALFLLDPEQAHAVALAGLKTLNCMPGGPRMLRRRLGTLAPLLPVEVMGIRFPNPVGLAGGFDKDGVAASGLATLGFGFIEVGTVTPRPQPGNPKPRVFRLPEYGALINRMGFNNHGVQRLRENLAHLSCPVPLGVNIGKNRDTPPDRAVADYRKAFRLVAPLAAWVTVNISSPNTPGLRDLQSPEHLESLLAALKEEQATTDAALGRHVPIALKIAPDLADEEISAIAQLIERFRFDAVIATNTTTTRAGVERAPLSRETGGLSGQPLRARSTEVVRLLYRQLQGRIPIIGVGGIASADDAWEKFVAGADLVQLFTAFVYEGPGLPARIVQGLAEKTAGHASFAAAVAEARLMSLRPEPPRESAHC